MVPIGSLSFDPGSLTFGMEANISDRSQQVVLLVFDVGGG
jgi:hypothetical protein